MQLAGQFEPEMGMAIIANPNVTTVITVVRIAE
jgi:hypothetical protein